jgi:hypothetical protein
MTTDATEMSAAQSSSKLVNPERPRAEEREEPEDRAQPAGCFCRRSSNRGDMAVRRVERG